MRSCICTHSGTPRIPHTFCLQRELQPQPDSNFEENLVNNRLGALCGLRHRPRRSISDGRGPERRRITVSAYLGCHHCSSLNSDARAIRESHVSFRIDGPSISPSGAHMRTHTRSGRKAARRSAARWESVRAISPTSSSSTACTMSAFAFDVLRRREACICKKHHGACEISIDTCSGRSVPTQRWHKESSASRFLFVRMQPVGDATFVPRVTAEKCETPPTGSIRTNMKRTEQAGTQSFLCHITAPAQSASSTCLIE